MSKIYHNYDLTKFNTFGVSVFSDFFTIIKSEKDLEEIFCSEEFIKNKLLILGEGSNVLFLKDYDGFVILNRLKGIEIIKESKNNVYIRAMGGEFWNDLVSFATDKNFWGIENLSLIPGTVGASAIQNIGAYGVELKDTLEEVEYFDISKNNFVFKKVILKNKKCKFGYRDSIFKNKLKGKVFISAIIIKLSKNKKLNIEYKGIKKYIEDNNIEIKTSKDVSKIVSNIRNNKLPNPKKIGNAGSFFKNVYIGEKKFKQLLKKYPKMPYFKEEKKIKIPTAWLVDQAGFKGKRFGNAGVYEKQALILVNHGNASGKEIYNLAKKITKKIQNKFGIDISTEVNLI